MKKLLFICGCPRSGTTELTRLVNQHQDVYVGCERYLYKYENGEISPNDFTPERFSSFRSEDSFYESLDQMEGWLDNICSSPGSSKINHAAIVGDKAPLLIYEIPKLLPALPSQTQWLVAIRDLISVIRSWKERSDNPADTLWNRELPINNAIISWTSSICSVIEHQANGIDLTDVYTPHLYRDDRLELGRILAALQIDPDNGMSKYIDGSIQWAAENPCARHSTPKIPTDDERALILNHPYVHTTVNAVASSRFRVDLDILFWVGFKEEYSSV